MSVWGGRGAGLEGKSAWASGAKRCHVPDKVPVGKLFGKLEGRFLPGLEVVRGAAVRGRVLEGLWRRFGRVGRVAGHCRLGRLFLQGAKGRRVGRRGQGGDAGRRGDGAPRGGGGGGGRGAAGAAGELGALWAAGGVRLVRGRVPVLALVGLVAWPAAAGRRAVLPLVLLRVVLVVLAVLVRVRVLGRRATVRVLVLVLLLVVLVLLLLLLVLRLALGSSPAVAALGPGLLGGWVLLVFSRVLKKVM